MMRFNMKPSKNENKVESTMKAAAKYSFVAPGSIRKGQGRGRGLRFLVEKENMPTKILFSQSNDLVKQYIQTIETRSIGKGRGEGLKNSTMSASQGMRLKNPIVHEKDDMQIDIPLPPSTDQVKQYTHKVETSSSNPEKVKRVRGGNKCKEVASLEVGQKLKVTFYNNRTVGTNSKLFLSHLGRIVRDRNMCPLGVSSWNDIKKENLNHMWAAIEDKFESIDMNDHRDHILGWMKELWNKWRRYLHAKYVKDKPIHQALKNPKGVDKKEWE